MFGGMGIWGVGRGRRGKKRREAEGGKGKDDARWRMRRRRTEEREGEGKDSRWRSVGGRGSEEGGKGGDEGREMKKFYLHFQPFMQRLTPFASLRLFLSLRPRALQPPCPSSSSFLLLLRFFFRNRASFLQPPRPLAALATSHPLTSAIPPDDLLLLSARCPLDPRSRGQPPR